MGRKARFQKEHFINAAIDLLGEKGPGGVTITGIAKKINAPVGSVYHRFGSREILLAELWITLIQSFQSEFLEALKTRNGRKAALHTLKWVRKYPNRARVFLLYRREDLMTSQWPEEVREKAEELANDLDNGLREYTQKVFGNTNGELFSRVLFALIEAPAGAVRKYLEKGETIPTFFDTMIEETYIAVLEKYIPDN